MRASEGNTASSILIVDDDEAVTQTFARMLRTRRLHRANGCNAPRPDCARPRPTIPTPSSSTCACRWSTGSGFLRRLRAFEAQRETPVAIVTGDYFLDERVSSELQQLGAELKFKPLWLEDLVGLARNLLKVTH